MIIITDVIRDENVLKFSIEYYNIFKSKGIIDDVNVDDIDTQEVYISDEYLEEITDYIILNHTPFKC